MILKVWFVSYLLLPWDLLEPSEQCLETQQCLSWSPHKMTEQAYLQEGPGIVQWLWSPDGQKPTILDQIMYRGQNQVASSIV